MTSPPDNSKRPIIIRRIQKGGHGHHGGSWKVAYADFVTAMMAFFMVMWLLGLDDSTRQNIERYFSHAVGFTSGQNAGDSPIQTGATSASAGEAILHLIVRRSETRTFEEVASKIRTQANSVSGIAGTGSIEVTVGEFGLRVELVESGSGDTYFPRGSATPNGVADRALRVIASELRAMQNAIIIEGHTDALPYVTISHYTNWELSADRANAARRILEAAGVPPERLAEVRAMASSRPRNLVTPTAAENRRIALVLPFISPAPPPSARIAIPTS